MFDNIGTKIKNLAKTVCAVGMFFSILGGGALCFSALDRDNVALFVLGILLAVAGCILSWVSVFYLYGFGEMVDKTCSIESLLRQEFAKKDDFSSNVIYEGVNVNADKEKTINTIICPNCGTVNENEDYYCKKCKTKLR
ncbi:MAG: hypothetical protein IKP88_15235 [Lachnospiraceae bacterium]|nr:hypothetical protein [Lachnospiraceae bacterium]